MSDGPIHQAFGLTYAAYFVMPRSVLQEMPEDWQQRFVDLINDLHDTLEYDEPDYHVQARDKHGRFITDELRHYRHPVPGLVRAKDTPTEA